jgi:putative phosphoesterase
VRVAVLSDTHFPGRGRVLPAACLTVVARADLVVHAGDLCDLDALATMRALGPRLVAVRGNVDHPAVRRELPETTVADAQGTSIGIVHDAGPERGRLRRMRRRFPNADGVVFGHSHIPLLQRDRSGFWILNPGSPTDRRRQPRHSMAELVIGEAGVDVRFHAVDEPAELLPKDLIRG